MCLILVLSMNFSFVRFCGIIILMMWMFWKLVNLVVFVGFGLMWILVCSRFW